MPERALGPYRLLSQLAVGGMAEIYVAKTAGVGGFEKLIALKVIHPNFSEDPEFVQMLVDEAKLAVQLQHANIVQTFDLGRIDEQYYIAMELIDGIDLYRLLRQASEKEIDFPFEVAAFIAQETSSGLDYAHRKRDSKGRPLKIVHRDVSPQNVLVSYDGQVKIVDFGIAKAALRGQQTAAGVIKGKYYYMSPEQAWGDPIDARSDVFSTGILLYEMLVGQMLYLEEDLDILLDRVRKADIPPPSKQRAGVPPDLEQAVMRALRKRADDRFQSAGELGLALARFIRGHAPDFNRARLASFVQQVLGDEPTTQNRDPRTNTALSREMLAKDENSLIFKLSDLKPPTPPSGSPTSPAPRARDQATSPVSLPELAGLRAPAPPRPNPADFEESDATIVDGGSDTLLAQLTGGARPELKPINIPRSDDPAFDHGSDDPSESAAGGGEEEDEETLTGNTAPPAALGKVAAASASRTEARELPTSPRGHAVERTAKKDVALPGIEPQLQGRLARPTPVGRKVSPRGEPARFDSLADEPTQAGLSEEEETRQRKLPPARLAPTPGPTAQPTLEMRKARPPASPAAHAAHSGSGAPARSGAPSLPPTPLAAAPIAHPAARPPASPEPGRFDDPFDEQPTVPPLAPAADEPSAAATLIPGQVPPAQPPASSPWPFQPFDNAPAAPGFGGDATATPSTTPEAFPAAPRPPDVSGSLLVSSSRRAILIGGVVVAVVALAVIIGLFAAGSAPARASIEVVSLPPGAEVRLDGTRVAGVTPLIIPDVDAQSTHHVRVSMRGYDVWEDDVKFDPGLPRGANGTASVRLQSVLVPTVGTLVLDSQPPGAEAIVNGRIRGTTPTTVGDLPPNEDVAIELRLRGYRVARQTVSWPKGGEAGAARRPSEATRLLKVTIPLEKAR